MKRTNYPLYALIAAGVVAVTLWAGMPPVYLLFLACPGMMLFMMRGMNSGQHQNPQDQPKDGHLKTGPSSPSDRSH
jgi:Protein of unknown function (DUF2933)